MFTMKNFEDFSEATYLGTYDICNDMYSYVCNVYITYYVP